MTEKELKVPSTAKMAGSMSIKIRRAADGNYIQFKIDENFRKAICTDDQNKKVAGKFYNVGMQLSSGINNVLDECNISPDIGQWDGTNPIKIRLDNGKFNCAPLLIQSIDEVTIPIQPTDTQNLTKYCESLKNFQKKVQSERLRPCEVIMDVSLRYFE